MSEEEITRDGEGDKSAERKCEVQENYNKERNNQTTVPYVKLINEIIDHFSGV